MEAIVGACSTIAGMPGKLHRLFESRRDDTQRQSLRLATYDSRLKRI
jgi:hypothetical protein